MRQGIPNDENYDTPHDIMHFLFGFKGRVGRCQYWTRGLFSLTVIAVSFFGCIEIASFGFPIISICFGLLGLITPFIGIWALVAINIKRLHDTNKSGIWLILPCVPVLGLPFFIYLFFVLGFRAGTFEPNNYGLRPVE